MRAAVLVFPALLLVSGSVSGQDPTSTVQPADLERTRQLVNDLSHEFGPADFRLMEPLTALADQLATRGEFDEAHVALDRAAQIVRFQEGLYTQGQYPLLLSKITNHANSGDWGSAQELMQHSIWLFSRNGNEINGRLISSLMELTHLHLRGVAEDAPVNQSYHFRAAMWSNRLAVYSARKLWGNADDRLAPMLYNMVKQHYLQAKAVDMGGTTGLKLRTQMGIGRAQSHRDMRRNAYSMGQNLLTEIREIFEQQRNRNDALALTEIYLADWEVLFSNPAAAQTGYERGFDMLLEAGVAADEINQYFAHPVLLPVGDFYSNWDQALSDSVPANTATRRDSETQPVLLSFQEWSPSIPFLHAPLPMYHDDRDFEDANNMAIFSFNLNGLEKISRWNFGRYRTAISAAHDIEMLDHNFTGFWDSENVIEQVQLIRFRPKLVNGEPQMVNATLRYQSAIGL